MREPTTMQKVFCYELAADPKEDRTQAAINAGYSRKTASALGSRLLNHKDYAHVQAFYKKLLSKKLKKLDITSNYVLRNIKDIGERCMDKVEIVKDGKPTGRFKFDSTGSLKAQELLGRYLRLFEDDEGRDPTVNVTVMPQIIVKGKPFKPKIGKQ